MRNKKRIFYLLALATIILFPAAGWLIFSIFSHTSFVNFLQDGREWYFQCAVGTVYGLISGFVALLVVQQPFMQEVREHFTAIIAPMRLNFVDVLIISFCAGFGEEILFRGALQPLLGLWPAAVLFVLVHGYINPNNWRLSIYGFYLIAVSVGFGYLFKYFGIVASAVAHMMVDIVLLWNLRKKRVSPENGTNLYQ